MSIIDTVTSSVGIFQRIAYWAVKLDSGKWLREIDERFDLARATRRRMDWALDLVADGQTNHIRELWLFCPPGRLSPTGNSARLPLKQHAHLALPGTFFQFKVATVDATMGGVVGRRVESQVIGHVYDQASGDCVCFIWDAQLRVMSEP